MTAKYAVGKYAIALCDTCNQRFPLRELKVQIVAGRSTNIRNCPYCLDKDSPQYFIGRVPINDPQALLNPRPDNGVIATRELWGWRPVGNPAVYASGQVGVIKLMINGKPSPITYSGIM